MQCPRGSFVAVALTSAALGCSAVPPPPPLGVPPAAPAPHTITLENPGGDAADPEWAALDRLSREPWGARRDRADTLLIPLVDAGHWTRVRLWGYPTRAAFRFGDEHYGVVAVWYQKAAGKSDALSCLEQFIEDARPAAEQYGVHVLHTHRYPTVQRSRGKATRVEVQVIDASVEGIFSEKQYRGALASHTSWPGTCLIEGFVVRADKHPDLASKVRERWVTQSAARVVWHPRVMEPPGFDDR